MSNEQPSTPRESAADDVRKELAAHGGIHCRQWIIHEVDVCVGVSHSGKPYLRLRSTYRNTRNDVMLLSLWDRLLSRLQAWTVSRQNRLARACVCVYDTLCVCWNTLRTIDTSWLKSCKSNATIFAPDLVWARNPYKKIAPTNQSTFRTFSSGHSHGNQSPSPSRALHVRYCLHPLSSPWEHSHVLTLELLLNNQLHSNAHPGLLTTRQIDAAVTHDRHVPRRHHRQVALQVQSLITESYLREVTRAATMEEPRGQKIHAIIIKSKGRSWYDVGYIRVAVHEISKRWANRNHCT